MKLENENIRLLSGGHISGKGYILSGLAKRTYNLLDNGKTLLAKEQIPINDTVKYYDENPELLMSDIETYPMKLLSDFIVKGNVQFRSNQKQVLAEIKIERNLTTILAIGNRRAYINNHGHIKFTDPQPVSSVPLRYDFAYGGADVKVFEKNVPKLNEKFRKQSSDSIDWTLANPYRYPRNPFGKGYAVEYDHNTFEDIELPNLEDPKDRLKSTGFFTESQGQWYKMPLPRSTGWMNYEMFPRINYFGFQHYFEGDPFDCEELKRKWVSPDVFVDQNYETNFKLASMSANGASLGLQLLSINPGDNVQLKNIHPKYSRFSFKIPFERPSIYVDGRNGKMLKTKPKIFSIELDVDNNFLSVLWCGTGNAIRPYHAEELNKMPLKVDWKN